MKEYLTIAVFTIISLIPLEAANSDDIGAAENVNRRTKNVYEGMAYLSETENSCVLSHFEQLLNADVEDDKSKVYQQVDLITDLTIKGKSLLKEIIEFSSAAAECEDSSVFSRNCIDGVLLAGYTQQQIDHANPFFDKLMKIFQSFLER